MASGLRVTRFRAALPARFPKLRTERNRIARYRLHFQYVAGLQPEDGPASFFLGIFGSRRLKQLSHRQRPGVIRLARRF